MIRPLYKSVEPFMEAPHGHGFQGVMLYDDKEAKCQCHLCGKWFVSVGQHSALGHGVSSDDYKMRFGFTLKTALCGNGLSSVKSKNSARAYLEGKLKIMDVIKRNKQRAGRRGMRPRQYGNDSMQKRNQHGLCAAQILARYEVVKLIVKRDPSEGDYLKYDRQLYFSGIMARYGNLNNFRKKILRAPVKTASDFVKFDRLDLIAHIRKAAKRAGRTPYLQDMKTHRYGPGPTSMTYLRHFGSWQNALCQAGLR